MFRPLAAVCTLLPLMASAIQPTGFTLSGLRHEVNSAQDKGLTSARHIEGGMAAWTRAGGERR